MGMKAVYRAVTVDRDGPGGARKWELCLPQRNSCLWNSEIDKSDVGDQSYIAIWI